VADLVLKKAKRKARGSLIIKGRRRIKGSKKRLNKKGLTSFKERGPPKLNKTTKVFVIF